MVLHVSGELDPVTTPILSEACETALRSRPPVPVIRVTGLDSLLAVYPDLPSALDGS